MWEYIFGAAALFVAIYSAYLQRLSVIQPAQESVLRIKDEQLERD